MVKVQKLKKEPISIEETGSTDSFETPFSINNNLTIMARQEITHELSDLLNKLTEVKNNIRIVGDDILEVKTVIDNLGLIENLLLEEDDKIFTKSLNITEKWEIPQC